MNKAMPVLIILNIAAAAGVVFYLTGSQSVNPESQPTAFEVVVQEKQASDEFESGLSIVSKNKKEDARKERITSRFFLPAMGERNAFTDMVDGMIVENIRRKAPVVSSYEKLLKEENPDISKEELAEKKRKFNEIMSEYLKKVYRTQRGLEQEGTVADHQAEMKSSLGQELGIAGARLDRLRDIESESKALRQLKVFERLLIRDKDKLSAEQEVTMKEILRNQQTTVFDPMQKVDDAYRKSDQVLQQVGGVLSSDQKAHFKYFQEYHWHSYDMHELNDMPTF